MDQSVEKKISDAGMSLEEVKKQLNYFKNGFPYLSVQAPATIGDGIIKILNFYGG